MSKIELPVALSSLAGSLSEELNTISDCKDRVKLSLATLQSLYTILCDMEINIEDYRDRVEEMKCVEFMLKDFDDIENILNKLNI